MGNRRRRNALPAVALWILSVAMLPAPADAALFLDTPVQLDYRFPDLETVLITRQVVVSGGVELLADEFSGGIFDVDVGDESVALIFTEFANGTFTGPSQGASFNGIALIDVSGSIPAFRRVRVNTATNLAGFDASRVSFDADRIFANLGGLSFTPDSLVVLDVAAVPEPSLLAFFAISGAALRRRSQKVQRGDRCLKAPVPLGHLSP